MPRGRPRKRPLTEEELINGMAVGSADYEDEIDPETGEKKPRDAAPKKRGPGRPGKSLKEPIGQAVGLLNSLIAVVSPIDVLNEQEGDLLVKGLDQAQQTDPRLRKIFTGVASKSGKLTLAYAVAVIVFERLGRRHMLPENLLKNLDLSLHTKQRMTQEVPNYNYGVENDVNMGIANDMYQDVAFANSMDIPPVFAE